MKEHVSPLSFLFAIFGERFLFYFYLTRDFCFIFVLVNSQFKPEFLNRIDEYVIFNSLSKADLRGIVKIESKRLEKRLQDRSMKLTMSEAALDHLADVGFDPVYGARPLKRTIQRELETVVAKGILKGEYTDGDGIFVDCENDQLVVTKAGNFGFDTPEPAEDMSAAFE